MAIFDMFKKKEKTEEEKESSGARELSKTGSEKQKAKQTPQIDLSTAKYPKETCAVCSQPGCDKKWGGQYWHKKCLRSVKGMARDMV